MNQELVMGSAETGQMRRNRRSKRIMVLVAFDVKLPNHIIVAVLIVKIPLRSIDCK